MSVILKNPPPHTLTQKFRTTMEGFLYYAAQAEMVRLYPGTAVPPVRPPGPLYPFLNTAFLPIYKVLPQSLRQMTLNLVLVQRPQRWREV